MTADGAAAARPARAPRVLLGVGGTIAAYKSALMVRALTTRGATVRCALSRAAASFITPLTLEVLSGHAVYQQEYLSPTDSGLEHHIVAAEWADVVCIAPGTAHLLGRVAQGLADDFLTTALLAFRGPVVIAPAMHDAMWRNAAVQANVDQLRVRGVEIVGPIEGPLASGDWGMGRLADPETIVDAALQAATRAAGAGPYRGHRVVISAGPTREPLDPVRFLGNRSSGKMGFALADAAARLGAEVTLIAGPVSLATPAGVARVDVETACDMRDAVYAACAADAGIGAADLVIMTAAVGDYRPVQMAPSKWKKAQGTPTFELIENPDILAGLPAVAPDALRVGFAAETEPDPHAARDKLRRKDAHVLVLNDVSRADIGFSADHNEVTIFVHDDAAPQHFARRPKTQLAHDLLMRFHDLLTRRVQPVSVAAE
ncbi:MAG: bifunctional phosphopantothenoylcysteine decarboxylase/phosphopantothenate--cysteine ligase CoaBC [Acidobacteriota bacterium]